LTSASTATSAPPATTALSTFSPTHPNASYPNPTITEPNA